MPGTHISVASRGTRNDGIQAVQNVEIVGISDCLKPEINRILGFLITLRFRQFHLLLSAAASAPLDFAKNP